MSRKINFGTPYSDTILERVDLNDVKEIKIKGTSKVWISSANIFANRSEVEIHYKNNINLSDLLPQNVPFSNYYTDIILPTALDIDTTKKQHRWMIRPEYNYDSIPYFDYIEANNIHEGNLMSPYIQEISPNNKYIPIINQLKNISWPVNQRWIEEFHLYETQYELPPISKTKYMIFDLQHTFEENTAAEKYPLHKEIYFSYNKPKHMFDLFKETQPESSNNLFERIMMMVALNGSSIWGGETIGGYKTYSLSDIGQNYFSSFDETEMIYLSETYHNWQVDWSHLYKLDSIVTTLSNNVNFLTYNQQLKNMKKCENEFLFFKIQKWRGGQTMGPPIKTYVIPASREFVSLIDSQIHRNIEYTYKVTGYCAVFGTQNVFHNVNPTSGGNPWNTATFFVDSFPSIKIVEIPLFSHSATTTQLPPMPPIVSLHNESNSSNKIKIYLELDKGSYTHTFTPIYATDSEQFDTVNNDPEGPYKFGYTNQPASFEVYRTKTKPKSYEDFQGHFVQKFTNNNHAPSMMIHDTISSNRKYYYTFRAVSTAGLVSNPSPIYEIELLKTSDESILKVNTVSLESENNPQSSKDFRNLINIFPSFPQMNFLNVTGSPAETGLDPIELGSIEERIWGKKFKIRVRSNDSGKAIDFNVKFNLIKKNS